ncbi:hypothetical protein HWV62_16676 [Athelia sp. TMB]|nr:hypothetical protein HWV62_16676 [Athelia sp. TMB]
MANQEVDEHWAVANGKMLCLPRSQSKLRKVFNTSNTSGQAQINNINGDFVNNVYTSSSRDRNCALSLHLMRLIVVTEDKIYRWLAAPDCSGNYNAAREKHHDHTGSWFVEGDEYARWKHAADSAIWVSGIDALDECTDRPKFLAWATELFSWGKLHILLSSRPERDIEASLTPVEHMVRVALEGQQVDGDIANYLDAMLCTMPKWNQETYSRVRDALLRGADGMFRWVALQIDELSKCHSPRSVAEQLRALPKGLDGVYEKILSRSTNKHDLKQFLLWLAFSKRPLEVEELADVVTVQFSSYDLPTYDVDLRYFDSTNVLVVCSGLVTRVEGIVKLAHMSVKDFLISERIKDGVVSFFSIDEALAHSTIAQTCLAYLLHLGELTGIDDSTLRSFPLASYAIWFWVPHMNSGLDDDLPTGKLISKLFSPEGNAFKNWAHLEPDPDTKRWTVERSYHSQAPTEIPRPLYCAALFGLEKLVVQLLDDGEDAKAQGGKYHNALQAASHGGHVGIVRSLLERGANVNAAGGVYGHALQAASFWGHEEIVRLLLESGADIQAAGGKYGTALQAASYRGNVAVVRLLLEHGADVNTPGGKYGSALQAASYKGNALAVRLLLEHGANVNGAGGKYANVQRSEHLLIVVVSGKEQRGLCPRVKSPSSLFLPTAAYGRPKL